MGSRTPWLSLLPLSLVAACALGGDSHMPTDRDRADAGRSGDAGTVLPPRDAGAPARDAGSPATMDAGPRPPDAGPRTPDAGPVPPMGRDSGPMCTCTPAASCTTTCGTPGSTTCGDPCAPACAPPTESCNARDDDCDGQCDELGCRAGVHRSVHPSSGEHFYTRDAGEAACCGFLVESFDYFFVYPEAQPGLSPFYRCLLASGYHFYTGSDTCEGAPGAINEGALGWVASAETCGAIPLYRLWHPRDGHFYTTSAGERGSAAAGGYVDEGVAAYVWAAR